MANEEPKFFTLRLVVDEEKNKVVLAEAGKDFADVLFSLLTLPIGTIVKLLEIHRKTEIGCFSKLYKSVVNMGYDNFETYNCKSMLLYPRSVRDVQCKRLKLNLHPTDGIKCYKCQRYSNSSTSQCSCGAVIKEEIQLPEELVVTGDKDVNGVIVNGRSSFILTDDLKVEVKSTELVLEKLKSLGYGDVSKLREKIVDIGLQKVLSLVESIFTSKATLTDTFLRKQTVTEIYGTLCMEEKEDEKVITLKAFVRKEDKKILFVECGEDFVELLFSFLALTLESIVEIYGDDGDDITLGCIANLCRSFKDLASDKESASNCFYDFQKLMPCVVITQQPPVYYHYRLYGSGQVNCGLTTYGYPTPYHNEGGFVPAALVGPKSHSKDQSTRCGSGFLKKETRFTVLDDLTITTMNSCSTVCILKKLQVNVEDLEVRVISISEAEALNLLRASMVTASSALNTALCDLITKEQPKKRPLGGTQLRRSIRKKKTQEKQKFLKLLLIV